MNAEQIMIKGEIKTLKVKVSKYLSKWLDQIQAGGSWTDLDIMRVTGWTNTRISEIRNFEKYQLTIPDKHLATLIMKGFITLDDLKQNCDLTPKETEYLEDNFSIYEIIRKNPRLEDAIKKANASGKDPAEIILNNL